DVLVPPLESGLLAALAEGPLLRHFRRDAHDIERLLPGAVRSARTEADILQTLHDVLARLDVAGSGRRAALEFVTGQFRNLCTQVVGGDLSGRGLRLGGD